MSISEIAKQAGVGIGTVSRYINGKDKVSEEAALKIKAAIDRVGYRPSLRRPGPKTAGRVGIKTGVILFVAAGQFAPEYLNKMPAYPMLLAGMQQFLFKHQLTLMYGHIGEDGRLPEMLDARYCDGIILSGADLKPATHRDLLRQTLALPAVWCFREHDDPQKYFDHIFYNNQRTGLMAAEYLAGRGHRHVAFFSSSLRHPAFCERQKVFTNTCNRLGLQVACFAEEVPVVGSTAESYRRLAEKFLSAAPQATGAFFCADDAMLGVYNELRSFGFDTERLDMIGCNHEEMFLRYITPRPASIDIRLFEIGELTAQRLLQRINGAAAGPGAELLIDPQLIAEVPAAVQ